MSRHRSKRKNFDKEKAIGKRLAQMRVFLGYSQADIAKRLTIGRERLSSYESGRSPVTASVGLAFCSTFNVNERWLATGVEPRYPSILYHAPARGLPPLTTFSDVYDTIASHLKENLLLIGLGGCVDENDRHEHARTFMRCLMDDVTRVVPKDRLTDLCCLVAETCLSFANDNFIKLYEAPFDLVTQVRVKRARSQPTLEEEVRSEVEIRRLRMARQKQPEGTKDSSEVN